MAENTERIHVNRESTDEDLFNDFRQAITTRDNEIAEMGEGQHDAHEFLLHLLKKLGEEGSDLQLVNTFLSILFSIGKREELSYQNTIIRVKEDSDTNQLTPSLTNEDTHDYASLNQFIEHDQETENTPDYKLDKEQSRLIGKPDLEGTGITIQKQTKITKLPWIITIQLNRADFANAYEEDDYENAYYEEDIENAYEVTDENGDPVIDENGDPILIIDQVEVIPKKLVVPKIKKLISIPEQLFNNYTLQAIVIHTGTSFSDGHYWTYGRWTDNIWYHYDDISNPSSELDLNRLKQTINPPIGAESEETPYLLFYVRDDFTPDALLLEVKLNLLKKKLAALKGKLARLKESLEQLKQNLGT